MGRAFTPTEMSVITSEHFGIHVRVFVNGTLQLSALGVNPFVSGTITADRENPIQRCSAVFKLGTGNARYMNPFLSASATFFGGLGQIEIGSLFELQTLCLPPDQSSPIQDVAPSGFRYRCVFRGYVDDVRLDSKRGLLQVQARDVLARTADRWFDTITDTDTGPNVGFTVPGGTIDDVLGTLYTAIDSPSGPLVVVGTPTLALSDFWQPAASALDTMRKYGLQNGWDLRGRWDLITTDSLSPTYYEPNRNKTEPTDTGFWSFTHGFAGNPKYYEITQLGRSLAPVRNRCDVIPGDATRVPQRVEDAASIATLGVRYAQLSEDRSSHITDEASALTLATIMLSELLEGPNTIGLEMPYFWPVEVNDLFRVLPNDVNYDREFVYGVSSVVHTFSENGDARTEISGGPQPGAAGSDWRRAPPSSVYTRTTAPAGPAREGAIWGQVTTLTPPA